MEEVAQYDVIKMRGEVGNNPPKKEMHNQSFLWRHVPFLSDKSKAAKDYSIERNWLLGNIFL